MDEPHDDEARCIVIFEAVDRGDVLVIQCGKELRFALKPRDAIAIASDKASVKTQPCLSPLNVDKPLNSPLTSAKSPYPTSTCMA